MDETEDSIFKTRGLYVILFGIALFPFIIKKELQELKIASQILFAGVLSFIVILSYQIAFQGNFLNDDTSYDYYWTADLDMTFIKGFSII